MRQADIVLYLFDANEMDAEELGMVANDMQQQNIKYLFVGNKIDKDNESDLRIKFPLKDAPIFISAKNVCHMLMKKYVHME